jgi:hypothetical protein
MGAIKSLAVLAAAVLALSPTSTVAADPSTLGCVGLTIGSGTMRALGQNALRRNDRLDAPPVDREIDALARATDACRRTHRWSEAAATAAGMWTMTSARLDAVAEALERDGVAPMRAGAVVGRLNAAEREGLVRDPISPSALNALRGYAVAAGLPTEGIAAHHFVWFTIMLIKEDRERSSFAAR